MEEITKRRLEVLNDTINHFNLTNRSTIGGRCTYFPNREGSEGCAVGRLIKDKELCLELDKEVGIAGTGVNYIFNSLPEDIKFLGQQFLRDLQNLHDADSYWTDTGLSNYGQDAVNDIKRIFELNLVD